MLQADDNVTPPSLLISRSTADIILGKAADFLLGKMNLERYLTLWVQQLQQNANRQEVEWEKDRTSFIQRLPGILRETWRITKGVSLYVLLGIAIGADMNSYGTEGFFERYMARANWYAVPLAVILVVPMYANAAGIMPLIQVFVAKGIPIGTALAFMMAVVGLSIPEATLLKKVMTWRLIGIFFGMITLFIIFCGYFFNLIL